MRLKESIASVKFFSDSKFSVKEMRLSGLLSEWLFATKFWAGINEKCGTIFDQYEGDDADEDVVVVICDALTKVINCFDGKSEEVEFLHGWDVNHTPLMAKVNSSDLVREMKNIRSFLEVALMFDGEVCLLL